MPETSPVSHTQAASFKRWKRSIQAQLRDGRVLLRESRLSLSVFITIIVAGSLIFHFFYIFPETNSHPSLMQALHATFALIFFEIQLPFPAQWYLQPLFIFIPIVGLAAVADGVLNFGTALINKRARGQKWQAAMASTYNNHIIICGFGKVGLRVAQELVKFGRDVVVIEANAEGRFVDKAQEMDIPLIIGDARRSGTLLKANVKEADAIIPCTEDELSNLDIALDARELNPAIKVVMRMFDPDLAKRVEKGFGIHTAFSVSALTAPIFATAAMRFNVKHSFYVNNQLLNISEVVIEAGSRMIGWTVEQVERELDISVVYYQHHELVDMHPDRALILHAGTHILVLASLEALTTINRLNGTDKKKAKG